MKGEIEGERETIGKIVKIKVSFNGKKGTIEFWKSYPFFSPLGYNDFELDSWVSEECVREAVNKWEEGYGISPKMFEDPRVIEWMNDESNWLSREDYERDDLSNWPSREDYERYCASSV
ncbi:MAG: hypothetical protein GY788_01205 [bacterium]|nr:hypothetical protein [bacterium]